MTVFFFSFHYLAYPAGTTKMQAFWFVRFKNESYKKKKRKKSMTIFFGFGRAYWAKNFFVSVFILEPESESGSWSFLTARVWVGAGSESESLCESPTILPNGIQFQRITHKEEEMKRHREQKVRELNSTPDFKRLSMTKLLLVVDQGMKIVTFFIQDVYS